MCKSESYFRGIVLAVVLAVCTFPKGAIGQLSDYTVRELPPEIGLRDNSVNDILQDHQGFIWLATWSGLLKYDGYSIKTYRQGPDNRFGLEGNKITCLFEDSQSRLWVGTNYTGFYRYDLAADTFAQFKHDLTDMNSLSNDNVWTITEDTEGYLWIGTENGLNRFDPESGRFVHHRRNDHEEGFITDDFITSLAIVNGDLWVGTEIGLNRLVKGRDGNHFFINYSLAPDSIQNEDFFRHNFIYKIVPSRVDKNSFWVGTSIGLKKVWYDDNDKAELDFITIFHDDSAEGGLNHRFVSDILEDKQTQQLWIATYSGINVLPLNEPVTVGAVTTEGLSTSLDNNVVKSLYKDRTGVLWIGTDKGTNYINLNAKPIRSILPSSPDDVSGNIVSCLEYDMARDGFWIGTKGGGIKYWSGGPGKSGNVIQDVTIVSPELEDFTGFISDIVLTEDGDMWLSTEGAGVLYIDAESLTALDSRIMVGEQFTMEHFLADDYAMALSKSAAGNLWIGYWDKGIDLYQREQNSIVHFSSTSDFEIDLQDYPVVHLLELSVNDQLQLWVGTRGGGLLKLAADPEEGTLHLLEHYSTHGNAGNALSNDFINCIYIDKSSPETLWVGTENGLNKLITGTGEIDHVLESDGLSNGVIQSIASVNGELWLSTKAGISTLSFDVDVTSIKNYENFDGRYYNFYFDESVATTPEGHVLFGGTRGVDYFKPADIRPDDHPPKVVLTDLRIKNESVRIGELRDKRVVLESSISLTRQIELKHDDNVISIEFVGLQFGAPEKIQYAYILEGFNDDWIYTDANERVAHYTNLPHADYTFKVKAANEDGIWSEPVELAVMVSPPWWLSSWAFLVYVLLFGSLMYVVWRVTRLRAAYKHELELERLEREKLEEVNQLKLRFFTNISHELRTPLTLIISPLEDLVKDKSVGNKLHKSYKRMYQNAHRLLNMINQLLDIRKSDAGQLQLKVVESNISRFVNEIVLSFKAMASKRQIRVVCESQLVEHGLWFDPSQMEKVIMNLMSNAIKFTNDGGRVEVRLRETESGNGDVLIEVKDSGTGIPADEQPYIFNRFYQVELDSDMSGRYGTGIGLALCKSIVEEHKGEIWVESQLGEGSSFFVLLQRGTEHFTPDVIVANPQTHTFQDEDNPDTELIEGINVVGKALSDEEVVKTPARSSVLIVEDNSDIREYLRDNLVEWYEIEQAANGQEGYNKAIENPPDLIIADVSMPVMDGIEMCRKIKDNVHTSHVPVILLTARTSLVYKLDGFDTGADDYITKPFNLQLLTTRIRNLIESRRVLREKFGRSYDLSPDDVVLSKPDEQLMSTIKSIIDEHIDDSSFSVEQLASELLMSRMQLYRKLKALTGKTPVKVIQSFRMIRASQLLKSNSYNVSDVTYMVGYNDLKSFRDQFKKEFGVNPSEYSRPKSED